MRIPFDSCAILCLEGILSTRMSRHFLNAKKAAKVKKAAKAGNLTVLSVHHGFVPPKNGFIIAL